MTMGIPLGRRGAVVFLAVSVAAAAPPLGARAQARDLYILAGQSNADGAKSNPAEAGGSLDDPSTPFWWVQPDGPSSRGWSSLSAQPGFFPSGHFGPEIGLARYFKDRERKVAVYKFAKGSTSLFEAWRPGDGNGLAARLVADLQDALAQSEERLTPACFVWVQGESDAATDEAGSQYAARLQALISDVRRTLAAPSLPVVLSVDEQHPWVASRPAVVQAQQHLARTADHVEWVSMRGFPKADQSHLTAQGTLRQGEALAAACDRARQPREVGPSRDSRVRSPISIDRQP